jgi:hypothetical protein
LSVESQSRLGSSLLIRAIRGQPFPHPLRLSAFA